MLRKYWKQFLSGSDIRGIAIESDNGSRVNLTNDLIKKITLGFARWLYEKTALPYSTMMVAVGHDSRLSAFRIKNVIIDALRSLGIKVYDCSLASTPAMLKSVAILSCTASIQITASHHPADRNGMKFFTVDGGLSHEELREVLEICQKEVPMNTSVERGEVKNINLMSYYCDTLVRFICKQLDCYEDMLPLKDLKIMVDAGNGAGGFFATNVLKRLGANTDGSIFLEPDGNFPNHIPNPEDEQAIKCATDATMKSKSDLGIVFDTDVDRVGFIDSNGSRITGNKLIALISAIILKKYPESTIVTDSVTSDKLEEFITSLGGNHFRFKRGYNNVISAAKKFNDSGIECHLAIETSGHAALKNNNFVDDGAYLACFMIAELVRLKRKNMSIKNLLEGFTESKEKVERRIKIHSNKFEEASTKLLSRLRIKYKTFQNCTMDMKNLEGVRLRFNSRWQEGWCLIRKSVHDPILVLNVESYVHGGVKSIVDTIATFLNQFDFIDISDLKI